VAGDDDEPDGIDRHLGLLHASDQCLSDIFFSLEVLLFCCFYASLPQAKPLHVALHILASGFFGLLFAL